MTRSMTRMALAGWMALAALGAVAVLDAGSATAEAASVSPFAGTYYWASYQGPAPLTISDGGRISGSYAASRKSKGSVSGQVGDDGSYSFTQTESYLVDGSAGRGDYDTSRTRHAGTMALVDGNIVLTEDTGGSFTWTRR